MDRLTDTTRYEYPEIKAPAFRLLRLSKYDARIDQEQVLQGALKEIPVGNSASFDAISYVWGSGDKTECLWIKNEVGRQIVPITRNCRDILRHLRDNFGVRNVWIDAVCINQNSTDAARREKSSQIELMTQIYGRARRVYIWLGLGSEDHASDNALDWLRKISVGNLRNTRIAIRVRDTDRRPWEFLKLFRILPDFYRAAIQRSGLGFRISEYNHEAMRHIIASEWFQRTWTLQEAVMAEEPWIVCGSKAIRLHHLYWGMVAARKLADGDLKHEFSTPINSMFGIYSLWLNMHSKAIAGPGHRKWVSEDAVFFREWIFLLDFLDEYGSKSLCTLLTAGIVHATIRFYRGLRPFKSIALIVIEFIIIAVIHLTPRKRIDGQSDWERRRLVSVLHSGRDRNCDDPKDKVYAFYGLLQQLEVDPPKADYSDACSLPETYLGFALTIIQWQGSLELLLEASGPWSATSGLSTTDAPSWVADWRRRCVRNPFDDATLGRERSMPRHETTWFIRIPAMGRELEILAKDLGKVVVCVAGLRGIPAIDEEFIYNHAVIIQLCEDIDTLRLWLRAATAMCSLFPNDIGVFLHAIGVWRGHAFQASDFTRWVKIMLNDSGIMLDGESQVPMNTLVPVGPEYGENALHVNLITLFTLATKKSLWKLHQEICSRLAEQISVFVVREKDGECCVLGSGSHNVRKNDTIALFPTPNVPMVVRSKPERQSKELFELMGAAFFTQPPFGQSWSKDDPENTYITIL